jgi:peptidoglycan/LPS O-acetylase OafA/YrhL
MAGEVLDGRPARVDALDGLRGWAALGVLFYHLTWDLFGVLFPIFRHYVAVLFTGGGALAVTTFFATSGYLLTIRRWRHHDDRRLLAQLVKRYARLTIPIMGSVLIYWAVLQSNLSFATDAAAIVHRKDWLARFVDVEPDLFAAITFGLYRVYIVAREQNYGPFLWTLAIQFWGSMIVLPIAYGGRLLREPYTPLLFFAVLLLIIYPPTAGVVLGALLALVQRDLKLFLQPAGARESFAATVVFFGCIALSSAVLTWGRPGQYIQVLLAIPLLVSAIRSRPLGHLFTRRSSRFMSDVSFPIYLVQCAVLISFTSYLVVRADEAGALTEWTALIIAIASVIVTLIASWAFLPIEKLATWVVKHIDRLLSRKPKPATVIA